MSTFYASLNHNKLQFFLQSQNCQSKSALLAYQSQLTFQNAPQNKLYFQYQNWTFINVHFQKSLKVCFQKYSKKQ